MNIIQQFEAEEIARLTAARAGARFPSRRYAPGVGEGGRGRAHPHCRPSRACASRAPTRALNSNFTVRKISYGEGVERVFPLYCADDRRDRGGAPRRCAAGEAVLPARPPRQIRPHRRARARGRRAAAAAAGAARPPPSRRVRWQRRAPRTLFDKVWDEHVVDRLPDGTCVLYIDRHLVHEVTSPQAFEGLRLAGRARAPAGRHDRGRRPQHPHLRPPRRDRRGGEPHPGGDAGANVAEFGVPYFPVLDRAPGHRAHHRARSRGSACRA